MSKVPLIERLVRLFEDQQRQLYVSALAITKERTMAEDAVHDAMLAVSELQQEPTDLKAYLFRTVRNKALHLNRHGKRLVTASEMSDFLDLEHCSGEQKVFANQVVQQLQTLDTNQQQVLVMKLFADLTFDEIARITDNSPNTVASWYRRGLIQLKERLYEFQN